MTILALASKLGQATPEKLFYSESLTERCLQLLKEYDVFVCYSEDTGISWAESIKKILEKRGYTVYVAHVLRHLLEGNFQQAHDNFIRKCKVFIFINTLDALNSDEIRREFQVAFPEGDTTKHRFWIVRDARFSAPYNSPEFQQATKIDLSKQNQFGFRNESELNSTIISRCFDDRRPVKENVVAETRAPAPQEITLTIDLTPVRPSVNVRASVDQIEAAIQKQDYAPALTLLSSLLEHIPRPPMEWLYNKAWLQYSVGRYADAAATANVLAAEYPDVAPIVYLRAQILYARQLQRCYY